MNKKKAIERAETEQMENENSIKSIKAISLVRYSASQISGRTLNLTSGPFLGEALKIT